MEWIYPIAAVLIVSLMSVIVAIPLFLHKKISKKQLLFLLSISVGVLIANVFFDLLPEIFSHTYTVGTALTIIAGFMLLFIIEKLIHWHHSNKCEHNEVGHSHAYNLAPINLLGDGIHNFIDGLVIAGAFSVNVGLGVTTTLSVIFHEIPQEIADFGVLLYSGLTKKKALLFNFFSASAAILGTIIGISLSQFQSFTQIILPFAAGNFLYIASANLVPQLHRHCKIKDTIMHILAISIGVAMIALLVVYGPAHAHG